MIRQHAWLCAFVAAYSVGGLCLVAVLGLDIPGIALPLAWVRYPLALGMGWMIAYPAYALLRCALWPGYGPGAILRLGMIAALLAPFAYTFNRIKCAFPWIGVQGWDPIFRSIDCGLHGVCPQQIVTPLIATPLVYVGVSVLYHIAWVALVMGMLAHAAMSAPGARRRQLLWSFFLTWSLLGSLLAPLLMSGGPVFYHALTGLDDYAFVTDWLEQMGTLPLSTQGAITAMSQGWESGKPAAAGLGISAMPSVHVAIAWLAALYAWPSTWTVRYAAAGYALFVMIASVALGWHYAIDGYAAIALTTGIWWVCGRLSGVQRVSWIASKAKTEIENESTAQLL